MAIQDTDKFIVNRSNKSYQVEAKDLIDKVQDGDLLLVNRSNKSYKATGKDILDSLTPEAIVVKPKILSPAEGAGVVVNAESDEIIQSNSVTKIYATGTGATAGSIPNGGTAYIVDVDPVNITYFSNNQKDIGEVGFSGVVNDSQNLATNTVYFADNYADGGIKSMKFDLRDFPTVFSVRIHGARNAGSYKGYTIRLLDSGKTPIAGTEVEAPEAPTANMMWIDVPVSGSPRYIEIYNSYPVGNSRIGWNAIEVNGRILTNGEEYTLTFSGNKDLTGDTPFESGDEIQQDSGHTPETSAITDVDAVDLAVSYDFSFSGTTNFNGPNSNFNSAQSVQKNIPIDQAPTQNPSSPDGGWFLYELNIPSIPNALGRIAGAATQSGYWMSVYAAETGDGAWTEMATGSCSDPSSPVYGRFYYPTVARRYWAIRLSTSSNGQSAPNWSATAYGIAGGVKSQTTLTLQDDTDLENFRVGDYIRSADYNVAGVIKGIEADNNKMIVASLKYSDTSNMRDKLKVFNDDEGSYGNKAFNSFQEGGPQGPDLTGEGWQTVTESPVIFTNSSTGFTYRTSNFGTATLWRKLRLTKADGSSIVLDTGNKTDANGNPWQGMIPADYLNTVIIKIEWVRETSYEMIGAIYINGVQLKDSDVTSPAFVVGQTVIGPDTTPPTGTVASTDSGANTMVLGTSDETFPKRWIANQGKYVIGKEYPSGDAAPDPDDVNFIGTNFVGTEAAMTHASSDWQVTEFADTTYSSPTSEVTDDPAGSPPPSWTSGELAGETKYRARVRYKSTSGVVSEWSDDRTFVTEKAGSDLAVKPGPIWATGGTAGKPGSLKTNPVKMVSVAWGELGVALGLDGKLYTGDLTYNNMKAKLTPAEPWLGMGVTYRKQGIGIIESSGNVDLFNAETGVYFAQDVEIASGVRCNRFSFCANDALMYVEGDDGNIYVANSLSPTSFRKLIDGKNVVDFAVGRKTYNKITFIDDQGDLYQADVSDTNDPAVTVSGYNQLYVGTKFKSIVSGYMGSLAATTQDNQIKIINPTANIQPELENLPAGVDLKEIGFGFYSIWALAKDGTVFVGGNASSHAEPLEGTPSATTWAKLLMPYPCRGLGMTKYSGGGYDFAFIIDEDA